MGPFFIIMSFDADQNIISRLTGFIYNFADKFSTVIKERISINPVINNKSQNEKIIACFNQSVNYSQPKFTGKQEPG
jgi:hypothetical protein